jgi:hypothetical protein
VFVSIEKNSTDDFEFYDMGDNVGNYDNKMVAESKLKKIVKEAILKVLKESK